MDVALWIDLISVLRTSNEITHLLADVRKVSKIFCQVHVFSRDSMSGLHTLPPTDGSPERITKWHFVFRDLSAANTCSKGNEEWFPTSLHQFPHFSLLYTWALLSSVNWVCLHPFLNSDLSPGEIFISLLQRTWSFSLICIIISFTTT